jgi:hypothetical protein
MVSWAWSETMQDLYDKSFPAFIQNFSEGRRAGLMIFGEDVEGEKFAVAIYQQEGREVFADAKAQIQRLGFVRFIGFGQGRVRAPEGAVDAFSMYYQDESDPHTRFAMTQYHEEGGAFACLGWREFARFEESWLPKPG